MAAAVAGEIGADRTGIRISPGMTLWGIDEGRQGPMVLANPDFVARLKTNAPMNDADRTTFYGGSEQGYIDYLALSPTEA